MKARWLPLFVVTAAFTALTAHAGELSMAAPAATNGESAADHDDGTDATPAASRAAPMAAERGPSPASRWTGARAADTGFARAEVDRGEPASPASHPAPRATRPAAHKPSKAAPGGAAPAYRWQSLVPGAIK